jgi:hypothetical protein
MMPAKITPLVVLLVSLASVARAQEPAVVANPSTLGFSPDRLEDLTQIYQGYSIPASCRAR